MTSPYLDQPKRDPDAAMFDCDHARHRRELTEISYFLQSHGAPQRLLDTLAEVHERIIDHAAARILERNKDLQRHGRED